MPTRYAMPKRKPVPERRDPSTARSEDPELQPNREQGARDPEASELPITPYSARSGTIIICKRVSVSGVSRRGSDASFDRILKDFPSPPRVRAQENQLESHTDHFDGIKHWDWADTTRLSGSTAFEIDWAEHEPSLRRGVLSPLATIGSYKQTTSNIFVMNANASKSNSGPMRTFFDDASSTSSTLQPARWTLPAKMETNKRKSGLRKVKKAAKKSIKKLSCFSPAGDDDPVGYRKASVSTVSTITSTIAEITDAVSQMKWRLYFSKMEERRRTRDASSTKA